MRDLTDMELDRVGGGGCTDMPPFDDLTLPGGPFPPPQEPDPRP